jgi:hypothetical protein
MRRTTSLDHGFAFDGGGPTAPGITRKWTRSQDYRDEVSNARVYAGFRNCFSTDVGKDMGKKIGELTAGTQLVGSVAAAQSKP